MPTYEPQHDPRTGRFLGVLRDGAVFAPRDEGNADWRAFAQWNQQQAEPLSLADAAPAGRVPRPLYAIRADVAALANAQKTAAWNDLTSGSPPKWALDAGPNAAALAVLQMLGASVALSAADVLEAKTRAAAMYLQDNPGWLRSLGIPVDGDEPA
ncbi:MAG TPA: hypothetical protein VEH84_10740 [Alphaproteobacteria bacterium]|nr:hypothetical protein [Alphaproteobacteria bacterium]